MTQPTTKTTKETANDLDRLSDLVKKAATAGADAADAVMFTGEAVSASQRMGTPEKVERSESADIGLRVIRNQRQAVVSATDFSPAAMDELVGRAMAMADTVPEDPYCGLADPEQLTIRIPDLDLDDPQTPATEVLVERAKILEEAACAVAGITNSEGAEAGWIRSRVALAASNGFAGGYTSTRHSVIVEVLAGEGLDMERDYEYRSCIYGGDLEDMEALGRSAGERAVRRLDPRKMATARIPVVFDPRVANSLVAHLASAANGMSIARGTSFLKKKMGKKILPKDITIADDPRRPRGVRSRAFDGEGLASERRAMVEKGVLKSWFLDLSSARQLGLESTAHATRGTSAPPGPSASNLYMEAGTASPEELRGDIGEGLYVTEMMGSGLNLVTGDYSRGAGGFLIENGELGHAVSEITIAGNLRDMFANLSAADDLEFLHGFDAPTLRVDGMTVAGS